jgi:aryl sulfotransferase
MIRPVSTLAGRESTDDVPIYPSCVPEDPIRYKSADEDSARWNEFPFRDGDIVISTRSKTGTTWVQMICALLIFQKPDLPDSLSTLSPWLDWLITPRDDVYAQLARQDHRRFIKTHTPLDGLPSTHRATYIVTGRHPLDMAVSLYHQGDNLDRRRMHELVGRTEPAPPIHNRRPLHQWLIEWISQDVDPKSSLDSLPGLLWHLTGAWRRRAEPNVVLVHYDDLVADLNSEMRRLAFRLGITVPEETWPTLVRAATFARMRERAGSLVPDPSGILKDRSAFFRRGFSGAGRETLTEPELREYERRISGMAPEDLLDWLHRDQDRMTRR